MPRLTEKYVQKAALRRLTTQYEQRHNIEVVVSETEVGVKNVSKLGCGRADGLIVAKLSDGAIYTVSLEAKSSKTSFNITPSYRDERWLFHAVLAGVVGLILAGIIGWPSGNWFWMWVFPLIVFIVISLVFLLITYDFSYYRPIDVISQIKRYPANEQWIAISTDVYNQLSGEEQSSLRTDCQRQGIGLIRVSAGEKINILEEAKPQKLPKGYEDFLECYAREFSLRKKLELALESGRVPDTMQR
jgi:hypothetical protein